MVRNFKRFEQSKTDRDRWQKGTFNATRKRMIFDSQSFIMRGQRERKRGELENAKSLFKKGYNLLKIARKMKYGFTNDSNINFGDCTKKNKQVTFIPTVMQLDTRECFIHRKDK